MFLEIANPTTNPKGELVFEEGKLLLRMLSVIEKAFDYWVG